MLEVLYHHAEFGGAWSLPDTRVAKNVKFFCLLVCWCVLYACDVTLLNDSICVHDFTLMALEYINILSLLDRRRFVVVQCACMFDFLCTQPIGNTTKCQFQKMAEFGLSTPLV